MSLFYSGNNILYCEGLHIAVFVTKVHTTFGGIISKEFVNTLVTQRIIKHCRQLVSERFQQQHVFRLPYFVGSLFYDVVVSSSFVALKDRM